MWVLSSISMGLASLRMIKAISASSRKVIRNWLFLLKENGSMSNTSSPDVGLLRILADIFIAAMDRDEVDVRHAADAVTTFVEAASTGEGLSTA